MKRLILIVCVLLLAGCGSGHNTPTPVADYAGNWLGNWESEEWDGVPTGAKSGTVKLSITSTGATTGSVWMANQNVNTSPPTLAITGQLVAGGTGTFSVTDTTTNTTYTGTMANPFGVDSNHLNLSGSLETTNTSGALWDYIDMGLSK